MRTPPPTLEQRLDELGYVRQPRASIRPGLRFPPGLTSNDLVPLACPDCGRLDGWWLAPLRAIIVCECRVKWQE